MLLKSIVPRQIFFGEEVDSDEVVLYYPKISDLEFRLYRMTAYLAGLLPEQFIDMDMQYASMSGPGWGKYYEWVENSDNFEDYHPFEIGLMDLIENAGSFAILLMPDDEQIERVIARTARDLINSLRTHMTNLACSPGLLGIISGP